MDYLHRLPFIIGAVMAVVVGMISYSSGIDTQAVYLRMAVCLSVFFIIGLNIKGTVGKIIEEVKEKKELEERKELERQKKLENMKKEEEQVKGNQKSSTPQIGHKVDDNSHIALVVHTTGQVAKPVDLGHLVFFDGDETQP